MCDSKKFLFLFKPLNFGISFTPIFNININPNATGTNRESSLGYKSNCSLDNPNYIIRIWITINDHVVLGLEHNKLSCRVLLFRWDKHIGPGSCPSCNWGTWFKSLWDPFSPEELQPHIFDISPGLLSSAGFADLHQNLVYRFLESNSYLLHGSLIPSISTKLCSLQEQVYKNKVYVL